jgi:hypothetical protein
MIYAKIVSVHVLLQLGCVAQTGREPSGVHSDPVSVEKFYGFEVIDD